MNAAARDPEFVRFARRAGVVCAFAVSVIALTRMLLSVVTSDMRATINAETSARFAADSLQKEHGSQTDRRIDRMTTVMELVVQVEDSRSTPGDRAKARAALMRMRHISP